MELVILDKTNFKFDKSLVVAIGQFDGIHLGHLSLLKKTIEIGKENNYKTAVMTFDPHPDFVLGKDAKLTYITPFEEKKKMIENLGFDYLIVINFDLEIANMEPISFVEKYLIEQNVKEVVVGFDFVFGKRGSGKAEEINALSKNRIKTTIISKQNYNNEKIASSRVKDKLKNGDMEEVKNLLGRYYSITGKIVYGKQVGKTIDVPTANLEYDEKYVDLKPGVYATVVEIDGNSYVGITNFGNNPSFNYTNKRTIETHILDFDKNIYEKNAKISFVKYLRKEKKFASIEEFQKQIEKDKLEAKKCVSISEIV